MNWNFIKTIKEGEEFKIEGYNIWDYKWEVSYGEATVEDPIYKNEYSLDSIKMSVENSTIHFGMVEFSNNIYGIYQYNGNGTN